MGTPVGSVWLIEESPSDTVEEVKEQERFYARLREGRAEAAALVRRLSDLVNRACGLTPGEVDLLWATAPPWMPGP